VIRFHAVTIFPEMFAAVTASGITSRALQKGLWSLELWNPRDFTRDNHRTVDDRPYGGGPGMVMLAEPLEKALDAAQAAGGGEVIYLSPQGKRLDHRKGFGRSTELRDSDGTIESDDGRGLQGLEDLVETVDLGPVGVGCLGGL